MPSCNTPEAGTGGVHGQLEGCNRNSRPKAAVAKVYKHGKTTKNSVELLYLNSSDRVDVNFS